MTRLEYSDRIQSVVGRTVLDTWPHIRRTKLLTFAEYDAFVQAMKVYPERFAIIYPALGLSGEAGEIAEKVKKWIRDDGDDATSSQINDERRYALLQELGDPLWYITSMAADLGFSLQDVVDANEMKLTSRKERGVLQGSGDNR